MKFIQKIKGSFPLVTRKRHNSEVKDAHRRGKEAGINQTSERYEYILAECKEAVKEIVKRNTEISFQKIENPHYYRVCVKFDARMMAGLGDRKELELIGEMIGNDVRNEIARCKFVCKG